MSTDQKLYSISEAADKIGVHPKTLRRWEDKGYIEPQRTLGGQRRYTNAHIELLTNIKNGDFEPTEAADPKTHQRSDKVNALSTAFGVDKSTARRWLNNQQPPQTNSGLEKLPSAIHDKFTELASRLSKVEKKQENPETPHKNQEPIPPQDSNTPRPTLINASQAGQGTLDTAWKENVQEKISFLSHRLNQVANRPTPPSTQSSHLNSDTPFKISDQVRNDTTPHPNALQQNNTTAPSHPSEPVPPTSQPDQTPPLPQPDQTPPPRHPELDSGSQTSDSSPRIPTKLPLIQRSIKPAYTPLLALAPFFLVALPLVLYVLLGGTPASLPGPSLNIANSSPLFGLSQDTKTASSPTPKGDKEEETASTTSSGNPISRLFSGLPQESVAGITATGGSAQTLEGVIDENYNFGVSGTVEGSQVIASTLTQAPFIVSSNQVVSNLNADLLDGHEWAEIEEYISEPITMQKSYEAGANINATSGDILINLPTNNTGPDSNFIVNHEAGVTQFRINNAAALTVNGSTAYPIDIAQPTRVSSNLHATKFLDTSDSGYYLDPGATDTSLVTAGQIKTGGELRFSTHDDALKNSNDGYLTSTVGFSVGDATSYYFDASGNIKANAGTFGGTLTASGTLDVNGEVQLGDGGDAIILNGSSITLSSLTGCTALETNSSGVVVCGTDDTGSSSQNLWATFTADTGSATANTTTDSLTVAGAGIVSTAISGDTLTITATEADTLAAVTARGATTATPLTFSGALTVNSTATVSGTLGLGQASYTANPDNVLVLDSNGLVRRLDTTSWDTDDSNDVATFLDLSDAPDSYSGFGSYMVRVNSGATGLEFADTSGWDQNVSDDLAASDLLLQVSGEQLHPKNALYHDILVGGTATDSATIALQATTGNILANTASLSGNLVLGASSIGTTRNQTLTLGSTTTGNIFLDGKVGLGTSNPTAKLDIYQSADDKGFRIYGFDDHSTKWVQLGINQWGNPIFSASGNRIFFGENVALATDNRLVLGSTQNYGIGYSGTYLGLYGDGSANSGEGSLVSMAIQNSTGNVGIGSSNPGTHLVVGDDTDLSIANQTGNAYIQNDLEVDGSLYVANRLFDTTALWQNTANVLHPASEYASIADLTIGGTSTSSAKFHVNAATGEVRAPIVNKTVVVDGVTYPQTCAGINAAIDALGTDGGEVFLPEGTYSCSETVTIDYNNTTIRGAGWNTAIDAAGQNLDPVITAYTKSQFSLSNMKIVASNGGTGGSTVAAGYSSNSIFRNLWIINSDDVALAITPNSHNVIVEGNLIENADGMGISVFGEGVRVANNFVEDAYHGIHSENDNVTITGNTVIHTTSSGWDGIRFMGDNNTITGNIVEGYDRNGIYFYGSNYSTVTGNTIRNSGNNHGSYAAIYVSGSHNTLTANTIVDTVGASNNGINVPSNSNYNLIANNSIRNINETNSKAININSGAVGNIVSNNQLEGNTNDIADAGTNTQITNAQQGMLAVGSQTTTPLNVLSVEGSSLYNNAAFRINDLGSNDLLTASASGTTRFTIANSGDITLANGTTLSDDTNYLRADRGLAVGADESYYLSSAGAGNLASLTVDSTTFDSNALSSSDDLSLSATNSLTLGANGNTFTWPSSYGTNNQVLTTDGSGGLSWADVGSISSSGLWSLTSGSGGLISPNETFYSLAIGGTSTSSAKFYVDATTGSASTSGNLTFDNATTIQTTRNQSLFLNPNGGNIGIGTSEPSGTLEIGSGQLIIPDGSSITPSIGFASSTNTGIARHSNGLALIHSGVSYQLTHGSTGTTSFRNGIGFGSSADSPGAFIFYEESGTLALKRAATPYELRVYNTDNGSDDEFTSIGYRNNANVLTIESEATGLGTARNIALLGGNVGIGTTAPSSKLDVIGDVSIDGYATISGSLAVGYADTLVGPGNAAFSGKVGIGTANPNVYDLKIHNPTQARINLSNDTDNGTLSMLGTTLISSATNNSIRSSNDITFHTNGSETIRFQNNGELAFNQDFDTFLARPAADTLAITTSGTEQLRVDSDGYVGIGTTNPEGKLHLFQDATGQKNLVIDDYLGNERVTFYSDIGNGVRFNGYDVNINMAGAIGRLVLQNSSSDYGYIYGGIDSFNGTDQPHLVFTNNNHVYLQGDGSGTTYIGYNDGSRTIIGDGSGLDLLVVDNGNVGIGTISPTATLDIAGNASNSGTLTFRGTTDPKIDILNGENFGIRTSIGGDTGLTERLTLTNEGNVGVGNTTPKGFLHIDNSNGSSKPRLVVGDYTVDGAGDSGSSVFTGNSWYEFPALVGVGSGSTVLDIPSISNYGNVGVIGVAGHNTGGRTHVGVYGHAYLNQDLNGNGGNNVRGGYFTTRLTSNVTDFTGSMFGIKSKADSTGGTSTGGNVYGTYSEALGEVANTVYGGYFTADGGTTNYSIYTNLGNVSLGDNLILRNDSDRIQLGAVQDLEIYHDGSNSYITNNTGALDISSTTDLLFSDDNVTDTPLTVAATSINGNLTNGIIDAINDLYNFATGSSGSSAFWTLNNGALYPNNATADLLIGGSATTSADFAFTGVNSGTPTASIGGTLALSADGTIQTTRNQSLILNPNGGNIGIGTSNPNEKIHVSGGSIEIENGTAELKLTSTTGFYRGLTLSTNGQRPYVNAQDILELKADNGSTLIELDASGQDYMSFSTESTERLRISHRGNVGIGTTSPQGQLEVTGDRAGHSLAIFNETGSNDIFTASASGQPQFTITNSGNINLHSNQLQNVSQINVWDTASSRLETSLQYDGNSLNIYDELNSGNIVEFAVGSANNRSVSISSGDLYVSGDIDIEGVNSEMAMLHVDQWLRLREGGDNRWGFNADYIEDELVLYDYTADTAKMAWEDNGAVKLYEGSLKLQGDDQSLFLGASDDASIIYNGSHLVFNSQVVGSGDYYFNGGDAYFASNIYQNGNQVCDASGNCTSSTGYWGLTNEQLHPKNAAFHDLLIGGTSTSSSTIALQANTGNAYFDGQVGIGTTNPTSALQLFDGNNTNVWIDPQAASHSNPFFAMNYVSGNRLQMFFNDNSSTNNWGRGFVLDSAVSGRGITLAIPDSSDFRITGSTTGYAASTDPIIFYINNAGHVGIGTTAPGARLEVTSNDGALPAINGNTTAIFSRTAGSAGGSDISIIGGNIGDSTINFGDTDDENVGAIEYLHNVDEMHFRVNGPVAMTLNGEGNLGIGTTNPLGKLDVAGNATISGNLTLNSTGTIQTTKNQTLTLGGNTTGNIILDGNVGIGTTSPAYSLDLISADDQLARLKSSDNFSYFSIEDDDTTLHIGTQNNRGYFGINPSGNVATDYAFHIDDQNDLRTNSNIIPVTASGSNLGSASVPFASIYSDTIYQNGNQVCDTSGNCSTTGLWGLTNEQLHPKNALFHDVLVGGTGTGSATIALQAATGDATIDGNLSLGTGNSTLIINNSSYSNGALAVDSINGQDRVARLGNLEIINGTSGATHTGTGLRTNGSNSTLEFMARTNAGSTETDIAYNFRSGIGSPSRLVIQQNGNVGIGTTAPTSELDVAGTASVSALTVRGSSPGYIDQLNGNDLIFRTSEGGDTGLTERLTLTAEGNLGIGTTDPLTDLDISDSMASMRLISGASNRSSISFINNNTQYVIGKDNSDNFLINRGSYTGQYSDFAMNSSGYIGIGTTSPAFDLDVDGDINLSAGNFITFRGNTTNGAHGITDDTSALYAGSLGDFTISFDTNNNNTSAFIIRHNDVRSSGTELFRVDGTGNVGIGTTNPLEKLDVAGNATVSGNLTLNSASTIQTTKNQTLTLGGSTTGTIHVADKLYLDSVSSASDTNLLTVDANGLVNYVDSSSWDTGTTNELQNLAEVYAQDTSTGNAVQLTATNGDIRFYNDASQEMLFLDESSGYVGIGTTDPSTLLTLKPSSINQGLLITESDSNFSGVMLATTNSAGYGNFYVNGSLSHSLVAYGETVFNENSRSDQDFRIESDTDTHLFFVDASANNIGIGTTAPARTLDVNGAIRLRTATTPSSPAAGDIYSNGTNLYYYNGSGWDDLTETGSLWSDQTTYIQPADTADYVRAQRFEDYANSAYFFDPANTGTALAVAGSIGIGTTNPGAALDVRGDAIFGTDDSSRGQITLRGDGTASNYGGLLRLDTAADYDTTYQFYHINAAQDDLVLGREGQNDLRLDQDGDFNVLNDMAVSGSGGTIGLSTVANAWFTVGTSSNGIGMDSNEIISAGNNLHVGTSDNYDVNIVANGSSIAHFDSANGYVGIGTTSPNATLDLNSSTSNGYIHHNYPTNGAGWIVFQENNVDKWHLWSHNNDIFYIVDSDENAGVYLNQNSTSWTGYSDIRLKSNIEEEASLLDRIDQLRTVSYNFRDNPNKEIGVIAQELLPVFPELVSHDGTYYGVNYDRLGAIAMGGIKEQYALHRALAGRVDGLSFTHAGELDLAYDTASDSYAVVHTTQGVIERIGAFKELVVGKIRVGRLDAQEIKIAGVSLEQFIQEYVNTLTLNSEPVSPATDSATLAVTESVDTPETNTNLISPLSGSSVTVDVTSDSGSLDVIGNASVSGNLTAGTIESTTIDELEAADLELKSEVASVSSRLERLAQAQTEQSAATQDELSDIQGVLANLKDAVASQSSTTDTLSQAELDSASQDVSPSYTTMEQRILDLETKVSSLLSAFSTATATTSGALTATYSELPGETATLSGLLSPLLTKEGLGEVNDASTSALLTTNTLLSDVILTPDMLSTNTALVNDFLSVTGTTLTTNAQVTNQLTIGSQSTQSLTLAANSISASCPDPSHSGSGYSSSFTPGVDGLSSCGTLYLQPQGGRINLLAGVMTLDSTGQVLINGDVFVNGSLFADNTFTHSLSLIPADAQDIASASAFAPLIAASPTNDLEVEIASGSAFTIKSKQKDEIASIDASGSATFAKLNLTQSTGTVTIPTRANRVEVGSDNLTENSKIFVTFQGSYSPATKYWLDKVFTCDASEHSRSEDVSVNTPGVNETTDCTGFEPHFVINLDYPVREAVSVDYWILN